MSVYFYLYDQQKRCKNFLVIFQLRWSDIFVKTKVILKPSVSVILYLPLNCAKHNITRRKPNITAQQYNLPQANITEKTTCRNKSFFLVRLTGAHIASQSDLLDDPKASPFGTRLRITARKTCHRQLFFSRRAFSRFDSFLSL